VSLYSAEHEFGALVIGVEHIYDVKRPTQIRRFVVALLVDTVEHEFGGIQKTKSPKGPYAPR
jgi:hypothetical protein